MKKSIRMISAIAMAAAMTLSIAGCSSSGSSSSSQASSTKKAVTISYIVSQGWLTDAEKTLGTKFEQQTGIKVDYQVVPADQYSNVLLTKLNSGECADIFGSQSGKFDIVSQLNVAKNAVDLSGESWISRFDPAAKEQVSVNNKVYGLTIWDLSPSFPIVYNKKIFSDNGISVPKTYADFKAACEKIKKAGVTPIYEPGADGWHMTLWFADIGPVYEAATPGLAESLNNNKATFAGNATMLTVLNQLKEMKTNGYFGANFLSQTYSDTEKNMGTGKFAMTLSGLGEPASIEKATPTMKATNFGYFEIPLADNNILDNGPCGPSKFIYSGSKHVAEAKQYFNFLTQQENLQYYLDNDNMNKVTLCFTGLKDKMNDEMKTFISSYTKTGTYYQDEVKYLNPQWADIEKDLAAMYTGTMTPANVLKNIDTSRAQQANAAKDPLWTK
jgi:raffinose/stachyose/melibiose transport system substrate-binding protein